MQGCEVQLVSCEGMPLLSLHILTACRYKTGPVKPRRRRRKNKGGKEIPSEESVAEKDIKVV